MVSKINFQILIATMNRENFDFLYAMFPYHKIEDLDVIIVNQTTKDKQLTSTIASVKVFNSLEKGLSKSRNLALENSSADWCLIADDDLVYLEGFEQKINKGIEKFSSSGVITFQVQKDEFILMRKYPEKSKKKLSIQEILNVSSVEMLINKKMLASTIKFNDNFGLGSNVFECGEEQVFLKEVKMLNYNISFFNTTIVHHPLLHTGTKLKNSKRYFVKGGIYAKMFPKTYKTWVFSQIFFDLKQRKISISEMCKYYKNALKGVQKLKEIDK